MRVEDLSNKYWLYDWLDSNGIFDTSTLLSALDSRTKISQMQTLALDWTGSSPSLGSEYNLVAGSELGRFNGLGCPNPSCKVDQIDAIFRHAWHYFDNIYVPDASGDLLRSETGILSENQIYDLSRYIQTAMYLREIGAQELVRYYASDSVENSAREIYETTKDDAIWAELSDHFLEHPERYKINGAGNQKYNVQYNDPDISFLPGLEGVNLRKAPKNDRNYLLRSLLARHMTQVHRLAFVNDAAAAQTLRGALGSTLWTQKWLASRKTSSLDSSTIAFNMEFPSLENVSIKDLIELRLDNKDSFVACRTALRKGMLELSKKDPFSPDKIADEIVRDLVLPEVARLRTKLDAARQVLAKKSAIALTIAGVSTWCGIHLGFGPVASLGAGSLAAFASGLKDAASKYSEERRDLEISDISFIWKAMKCKRD